MIPIYKQPSKNKYGDPRPSLSPSIASKEKKSGDPSRPSWSSSIASKEKKSGDPRPSWSSSIASKLASNKSGDWLRDPQVDF